MFNDRYVNMELALPKDDDQNHAGPEFRSTRGQLMIIKKALYRLQSSGTTFRANLANMLYDIGFILPRLIQMSGYAWR